MEERHHQAELCETILGAITPRVGDEFVEGARKVRLILKAQPASEIHGAAAD